MRRHLVMDLFFRDENEVVDGPWNDISHKLPKSSCKVMVKQSDHSEYLAYFYPDISPHFWDCIRKEPFYNVTHFKHLKKIRGLEREGMKKRTLTLLVELDEELEKPIWIWDSHMANRPWYGVYVKTICEGNQICDHIDDEPEE